MVDEFHAIPRLSASGMYRVFGCAASHAREWEAYDLRSLYGVPPPETPKEAINGTQRHLLLSVIPFFSRKLGIGKPLNLHEVLQAEASNLAIRFESAVDYWFCYNAVLKRNRLITHVIEQLGPTNIDKISIRLDDQRLYRSLSLGQGGGTAEVSGLPDVNATIRTRSGELTAVICDYKSGYKEQTPAKQNKQLLTLAHLLDHREPLTGAYVSLFAKTHRNDFIDAAYYDRPLLKEAGELVALKVRDAAQLQRLYRAEIPTAFAEKPLSAGLATRLDAASKVDASHCALCSGKVCCSKLRENLAEFKRNELDPRQSLVDAYRGIKRRMKPTKKNPQGATMTTQELSRALIEVRRVTEQIKLFTSLDKELSDVARGMLENQNKIPGVTLEDGNERFALKEGVTLGAITDRLQQIVPGLDKDTFINQFGNLKLADVRAYLANSLAIDESAVLERLQEGLKDNNPFYMKSDQPSVAVDPTALELMAYEGEFLDEVSEQSLNRI
jgi:hypothetical protein